MMESLGVAALMGLVEGLTEFLPVSSTGHLILAGDLLGFSGPRAATFEVVVQVGAILAVLALYWRRFLGLLLPDGRARFAGWRGIGLLLLTTLPGAALGLAGHQIIKSFFSPATVAAALAVGAALMLAVEHWARNAERAGLVTDLDQLTARQAFGIGCFQCLALWPGFSRSASTLMGGMLLGVSRKLAAEYSFIAAVPIITGAAGYDLLSSLSLFQAQDIPFFLVGSALAFGAALAAMRGFIALLGHMTLRPFAVYRLILAPLVYFFMVR